MLPPSTAFTRARLSISHRVSIIRNPEFPPHAAQRVRETDFQRRDRRHLMRRRADMLRARH
jgi:hypothetical protein